MDNYSVKTFFIIPLPHIFYQQPAPQYFFFLMIRHPPRSPLFPNTTLFRSEDLEQLGDAPLDRLALLPVQTRHEAQELGPGQLVVHERAIGDEAELELGRDRVAVHVVAPERSEEHTSELQSQSNLVCRLLLE